MYPPRIPDGFEQLVRDHIRMTRGEERDRLSAHDFPLRQAVQLRFADGSFAHFEHAFFVEDVARERVAVFTEHCGYHVFGAAGVSVVLLQSVAHAGDPGR